MTRDDENGGSSSSSSSRRSGGDGSPRGSQLRRNQSSSPLRQTFNEDEGAAAPLHGLGIEGGDTGPPADGDRVEDTSNGGTTSPVAQDENGMLEVPSTSPVGRRGSQARVRFSTDLERGADAPSSPGTDVPRVTSDGQDRRPASRGLTVDTSVATSRSNPASGSSPEEGSNSSPSPQSAVPPLSPRNNVSAQSKTRNRGYSLRRALFFKNIQTQAEDEESVEMTPNPSSEIESKPDAVPVENVSEEPDKIQEPTTNVTSSSQDDTFSESSDLKGSTTYSLPSSHRRWAKRQSSTRATLIKEFKDSAEKARKFIFRIKDVPPSKDGRHIDLDPSRKDPLIDERTGGSYIGNTIRSSRYSLWSFFPRQLVAQFSKLANFYFLVISILQMIPGLSTTGTFTTLIPLMIFVGISMGKEGFDDLRRYRLDKEENNRIAHVLRPGSNTGSTATTEEDTESTVDGSGQWVGVKWKDIKVGDVIKIHRDQPVPADIALLHAGGDNGIAYIETMALDGETNLKNKQPCRPVAKSCETVDDIVHNSLHFVVEDPNIDLYKFDGNVRVGDEKLPLTNNEVIYRGSVLRNTPSAIGMVIYSGEECKIRMNANKNPRIKSPAIQTMVNRVVMVIVLFVVVLASVCTIAYKFWSQNTEDKSWYLEEADVSYGPIFTSFLIMYNTMIPISLYVSLEIVKVAQMFLLNDIDMYDPESDTPMEARTSTINEELGQVSYIFSDKTGTLTNNSMRFRKMSVAGTAWFHDSDLREDASREGGKEKLLHKKRSTKGKKAAASRKSGVEDPARRGSRKSNVSNNVPEIAVSSPTTPQTPGKNNPYRGEHTSKMLEYIQQKPYTAFARKAKFFILTMALCHTCVPEVGEDGDITYQAASPDELALVIAAKELGYLVVDRQPNHLTIKTFPNGPDEDPVKETYEILDVIEFSSARKRMSVVVRMPDQRICIFSKGADSTLMQLLRRSALAEDKVQDIERKANKRKAMEAMEVMRRNSEHRQTRKSIGGRTSISIGRPSLGGHRRSSVSGKRVSMRDSIDVWLRDREADVSAVPRDDGSAYSPRPSAQFARRQSSAFSDGGNSLQTDDGAEDLVEESLVLNEAMVFERCFQHLNDFATEGLRTLLYGYRFMDDTEYEEWKQAYHEATTSLVDRQKKIEEVGERVENELELIGATAIEDKLQKGVPEAIEKLRRANIKLWMLTGDKRETAINIGHSCRLVKDYSTVVVLDHEVGDVDQVIATTVQNIVKGSVAHSVVVIDGQTLSSIEADAALKEHFFDLAILADSVICCRASPKQKAFLVRSIRKRVKKSITLAIGDGANDIAMIQEAHVGIGITGKEGLQAARISDYSIAQFRFLLKLLLVHGRWNYIRVCKYTLGTFWKETLFYLTQALYQRWNGYTGTSLYEQWSLSMFNTLFTSLPVIFLGIFEKDLAASTLLAVPELYTKGQRHAGFNIKLYLGWAFMATCEAMVVYFTMLGLFGETIFSKDQGVFAMGFLTFTACVIIINMKLQFLEIHNKSIMAFISILLSVGGWFLWNIILSRRYVDNTIYNVKDNFLTRSGRDLLWWVTLLLSVMAVILFEITVSTIRSALFPTDVDTFQEYEQDREIRKRFEEAASEELQLGWDRGDKKSSFELANMQAAAGGANDAETQNQDEREQQVQDLLDRPRVMDKRRDSATLLKSTKDRLWPTRSGGSGGQQRSGSGDDAVQNSAEEGEMEEVELTRINDSGGSGGGGGGGAAGDAETPRRRSVDIQVLLSRGFGSVRKGQELK